MPTSLIPLQLYNHNDHFRKIKPDRETYHIEHIFPCRHQTKTRLKRFYTTLKNLKTSISLHFSLHKNKGISLRKCLPLLLRYLKLQKICYKKSYFYYQWQFNRKKHVANIFSGICQEGLGKMACNLCLHDRKRFSEYNEFIDLRRLYTGFHPRYNMYR